MHTHKTGEGGGGGREDGYWGKGICIIIIYSRPCEARTVGDLYPGMICCHSNPANPEVKSLVSVIMAKLH